MDIPRVQLRCGKGWNLLLTGDRRCYLMRYFSSPLKWRRKRLLQGKVDELCLHKLREHNETLLC